jgi:hypothetical protein
MAGEPYHFLVEALAPRGELDLLEHARVGAGDETGVEQRVGEMQVSLHQPGHHHAADVGEKTVHAHSAGGCDLTVLDQEVVLADRTTTIEGQHRRSPNDAALRHGEKLSYFRGPYQSRTTASAGFRLGV